MIQEQFALKCTAGDCGFRFNYVEMVPIENTELGHFSYICQCFTDSSVWVGNPFWFGKWTFSALLPEPDLFFAFCHLKSSISNVPNA